MPGAPLQTKACRDIGGMDRVQPSRKSVARANRGRSCNLVVAGCVLIGRPLNLRIAANNSSRSQRRLDGRARIVVTDRPRAVHMVDGMRILACLRAGFGLEIPCVLTVSPPGARRSDACAAVSGGYCFQRRAARQFGHRSRGRDRRETAPPMSGHRPSEIQPEQRWWPAPARRHRRQSLVADWVSGLIECVEVLLPRQCIRII